LNVEIKELHPKDYLDIIHHTFIWRNLDSYGKNPLKKVQKAKKGFFVIRGYYTIFKNKKP